MRKRGRHVGGDQLWLTRIPAAEVIELDVPLLRHGRAGVDEATAAEVHNHEQLLLRPHSELTRGDPDLSLVGTADLSDDPWPGWILGVDDKNTGVLVSGPTVGAVAYINEVS